VQSTPWSPDEQLPDAPQKFTSEVGSMHVGEPPRLQLTRPGLHVSRQLPPLHTSPALHLVPTFVPVEQSPDAPQ
jgi:hypothetical protein